jgi:hypothetical protein
MLNHSRADPQRCLVGRTDLTPILALQIQDEKLGKLDAGEQVHHCILVAL